MLQEPTKAVRSESRQVRDDKLPTELHSNRFGCNKRRMILSFEAADTLLAIIKVGIENRSRFCEGRRRERNKKAVVNNLCSFGARILLTKKELVPAKYRRISDLAPTRQPLPCAYPMRCRLEPYATWEVGSSIEASYRVEPVGLPTNYFRPSPRERLIA